MAAKLFRQRFTNRPIDTVGGTNSFSFHGRLFQNPAAMDGTNWYYATGQLIGPSSQYLNNFKAQTRNDSVLHTDLFIPKYSKILGAHIEISTDLTVTTITGPSPTKLDVALYPELSATSDQDNWRGFNPTKTSWGYEWRHVATRGRDRVNPLVTDGGNFSVRLGTVAPPPLGQTSCLDAAATPNGNCRIGNHWTDSLTGQVGVNVRGFGQVVQVDSSGSITTISIKLRRVGTYVNTTNIVCRVYSYDATTRTRGALRTTSTAVVAGAVGTGTQNTVNFSFSSFALTAGEYVLCLVEPETEWNVEANGIFLIGRFVSFMDNTTTGTNAAGSEEIMWWCPPNNGNANVHFYTDEPVVLYTSYSGNTIEDRPYNGVIETLQFDRPVASASTKYKLFFNERMIKNLQNYNNSYNDANGVKIYLSSYGLELTGTEAQIAWDALPTANNGLFVVYRSTRTFIT